MLIRTSAAGAAHNYSEECHEHRTSHRRDRRRARRRGRHPGQRRGPDGPGGLRLRWRWGQQQLLLRRRLLSLAGSGLTASEESVITKVASMHTIDVTPALRDINDM